MLGVKYFNITPDYVYLSANILTPVDGEQYFLLWVTVAGLRNTYVLGFCQLELSSKMEHLVRDIL